MKVYHKFRNKELQVYMQNWPLIINNEIHQYNTRISSDLHTFRYHHTFARKSLRHYLVLTINNTPDNVFSKFGTHSLNGFSNYVKLNLINNYQDECNIHNCYIMFSNIANIKFNITQSIMQTYRQVDIHMYAKTLTHTPSCLYPYTHARISTRTYT